SAGMLLTMTACSNDMTRGNVPPSVKMEESPRYARTMRYVRTDVDYRKYSSFIIDPADVYTGADAEFGSASQQDKLDMADYTYAEFRDIIGAKYPLVTAPAPNVARIHMTVVGMEATQPLLSTVTHLAPAGLALNTLKGVSGGKGSFMGSVTLEIDVFDSVSNELIASVVTNQQANALDITSVPTKYGAARTGVQEGAEKLLKSIDEIQAGKGIPQAD
ncbi:MAG TPA: DUF3313 domain-containing protein, partial [Terriglobales bacterium]|nr:DUF3313 domain-containing protein [Terriglobales bacterium]